MPRFMIQVRGTPTGESTGPSPQQIAEMMSYNQSLIEAGVMLSGNGLLSTAKGVRVTFDAAGQSSVAKGPFELSTIVSGYWIFQTETMEEAIAWARKAPIKEGVLEVRQVASAEDFE